MKQDLVGILQFAQESIAMEIGIHAFEHLPAPRDLFLQRQDMRRKQAVEPEMVTLFKRKGGAPIGQRIVEQGPGPGIIDGHGLAPCSAGRTTRRWKCAMP